MRVLVDTNILVYAVNRDAPQHAAATAYLSGLADQGDRWCLTWAGLYEFLCVTTHPALLPKPLSARDAWAVVARLLENPTMDLLAETAVHQEVLRGVLDSVTGARGAFLHDCHVAALMREHDVATIATADADFRKFAFLTVVDPTRS